MFSTSPPLKHRIAASPVPLIGGFVFSTDPGICEVYAEAGFDFVVVDMEHGLNDVRTVFGHLRSCAASRICAVIRLGVGNFPDVARLLDSGAEGFMFPHLGLPGYGGEAAIQAMRYPPVGNRPSCTGVQSAGYGLASFRETVDRANRDVVAIGLVEDRACVDDIDNVLDRSGVDWIMPGPGDLASSYGVHGQLRAPVVREATARVADAAARRDIPVGMYITDASEIAAGAEMNAKFYVYSLDYKILGSALRDTIRSCRGIFSGNP